METGTTFLMLVNRLGIGYGWMPSQPNAYHDRDVGLAEFSAHL